MLHTHRRQWLQSMGAATISMGPWFVGRPMSSSNALAGEAGGEARAKSCILIWLDGGPSHLETFDPKPDAPVEVRGPLSTIGTSLPGVRLSECLPQLGKQMDRWMVIRSVTSPLGEHNFGTHYLMTGYKPTPALEYPTHGAILAHLRPEAATPLPPYVAAPSFAVGGSKLSGNGFLPSATRPFSLGSDPSSPNFQVRDLELYPGMNLERLARRKQIVGTLDDFSRQQDAATDADARSDLERAFALATSPAAKRAFDIQGESPATRAKYGPKSIGGCCLLARRLVEQGVGFVTVNSRGWDTHTDMVTRLKDGFAGARKPVGLVPSLDQALAALTDDLDERGLLEETLVVVMGEFGRTPKINTSGGRDHWPRVFSVAMAGGGIRGGQVMGASDAVGEQPRETPVTPSDIAATIYTLLGISPSTEVRTSDGRPIQIVPPGSRSIVG